jgi:ubiquinone/menaquinone biosynthesis C-methylase UbiE
MLSIEQVYNKISNQFDRTRIRIWGSVKNFLNSIPAQSSILEIGCGNGKNMLFRKDLDFHGIDLSEKQVEICKSKNLNVNVANMTSLPFSENQFNYAICIATYHHLDNDIDRKKSLEEIYRILKKNGRILLTVWAIEQDLDSHVSFKNRDEMVPWKNKDDGNTYYRYYHVYGKNDLEEEIKRLCPRFKIEVIDFELGNWYVILSK